MKYKIAYEYKLAGEIEVEAESLEQAKELSLELSANNMMRDEYYVGGSFSVNDEVTEELNK